MQEKKKKPLDGAENMALATAMLGNFLPSDADKAARDEALGNFEARAVGEKRAEKD